MNHKFADSGIPRDSAGSETALGGSIGGRESRRVAIVCRAMDEIVGADDWMEQATRTVEYLTLIDWENVEKTEPNLVGYEGAADIVDLFRVARETRQTVLAAADAVIALD